MLRSHWRRIVGGIGFLLAVAWLAGRTCRSESAEATVRFRLGDGAAAAAAVRAVRAELRRGDDPEVLAYWQRNFDERGSAPVVGPWTLRADAGLYRVDVEVRTASGSGRVTRSLDLQDGAAVTVDAGEALSAATGRPPAGGAITPGAAGAR